MKFEWDAAKSVDNLSKHGVSFEDASTVFGDPLAMTAPDPDHSAGEPRFITMGVLTSGRLIVVCHADENDTIRIISAREASTHERKRYES